MNCPNCQQELPDTYDSAYCAHCGKNFPSDPLPSSTSDAPPAINPIRWGVFFAIFLAPAIFALLGSMLNLDGLAAVGTVFGAPVAGIICGGWLGIRIGQTTESRFGIGLLLSALMGFVSFVLCCIGCSVGDFHFPMG